MNIARIVIVSFTLAAPASALAADHAATHYARGLVELNGGRYTEAIALFDRALDIDGGNIDARYYRGIAHSRLENWDAAAADLQATAEAAPELPQPALELGIALVNGGRYTEAHRWLSRARDDERTAARAQLFSGVAHIREGNAETAIAVLEPLTADASGVGTSAHYYLGLAHHRAGDDREALRYFTWVSNNAPGKPIAAQANDFIAALEGDAAAAPRRWRVRGSIGLAYDSNVSLTPDDALDVVTADEGDGRTEITAGGQYTVYQQENTWVTVGYDFFQSLHFDLDAFDLQNHRASAQFINRNGAVTTGLLARYDYYMIDGDTSFLQQVTLLPWLRYTHGDFGRTDVHYRFRNRDYKVDVVSQLLDGDGHQAGVRQYFYIDGPTRNVSLGYAYTNDGTRDAENDAFAYDAHAGIASVGWDLPLSVGLYAEYKYEMQDYDSESADFDLDDVTAPRNDDDHRVVTQLRRPLNDNFAVALSYVGTFSDSDNPLFEYERHIGSLTLEASY